MQHTVKRYTLLAHLELGFLCLRLDAFQAATSFLSKHNIQNPELIASRRLETDLARSRALDVRTSGLRALLGEPESSNSCHLRKAYPERAY